MPSKEHLQWLKNRWEFMRRDPSYLKAWKQYRSFIAHEIEIDEGDKSNAAIRAASELLMSIVGYETFGLSMWLDPALSFEEIKRDEGMLRSLQSFDSNSVFVDEPTYEGGRFDGVLSFHVDISKVNSITALKNELCRIVDQQMTIYKEKSSKPPRRDVDYEVILAVGTLKEQGFTNETIAMQMFPRDFDDENLNGNPESATRKISHYYMRYKELIGGGYRDMRYP
ncbi:MAG: hypothetical protein AB2L11_07340 [Syntrophobacteraceae bacterium]